ncbi:MAG: response regulator [Myxococcus sp.]|nr:response regulator [Myxococcus sp.]
MFDVDRVLVRSASLTRAVQAAGLEPSEQGQAIVSSPDDVLAAPPSKGSLPVIVVTEAPLDANATARLLRLGVNVVLTEAQLKRLELAPPEATVAERFATWARKNQLTGHLRVLKGSPLEGVATFEKGQLTSASFCWLDGAPALEQMLGIDDSPIAFEGQVAQPAPGPRPVTQVLVAEDDEAIRGLIEKLLAREGYKVLTAPDGAAALALIERFPIDAVVSDIDMPRLDGWGLLRTLRADAVTRELPVVLLSAYEDSVMTLRAAKSGARAYLKKTGRSKELVDALALLTAPRRAAREGLSTRREFEVDLKAIGAHWLLSLLAEHEAVGRVELEDELGRYEVEVSEGKLVRAVAQNGSLRVEGVSALEAIITSRATGRFVPVVPAENREAPELFTVLADVHKGLLRFAAARVHDLVISPRRLAINEELAAMYGRAATANELRVLGALRQAPPTLAEVAAAAEVDERQTERILAELLKRGVVSAAS